MNEFNPFDEYDNLDFKDNSFDDFEIELQSEPTPIKCEDDSYEEYVEEEYPQVEKKVEKPANKTNSKPPVKRKPAMPQYMPPYPYYGAPVYPAQPVNRPQQPISPVYYPQQPPVMYPPQGTPVYPYPPQPAVRHTPPSAPPVQSVPQIDYTANPYVKRPNSSAVNNNAPKQKLPVGTKIFIGIILGLLLFFIIAFCVSCSSNLMSIDTSNNPLEDYIDDYYDYYGDDYYYDDSEDYYYDYYDNSTDSGSYIEEDVVLSADDGATQEKTGDIKNNSYDPDTSVPDLKSKDLPKNQTDSKYSAQYSFNEVAQSVVAVQCSYNKTIESSNDIVSEGTGIVITEDGYIVTNSHIIGDCKAYYTTIIFNDGTQYQAKIVGYDSRTDLAVLKIDASGLTPVKFGDSSQIEIGQDIITIGNPGGANFQNSLTKGIVSALDREIQLDTTVKFIQIDAPINPGNSGGPLCNIYGQVIGINTAKISSSDYEGMGFAIPSDTVLKIANDLIHYGYVQNRVMLGISGVTVDLEMSQMYAVPNGIVIVEITEDGPLGNTDIKPYDIITQINGEDVTSFSDIYTILDKHKPGDKITVTVYRLEE